MQFQENILGLIGHTPLVKLNRLARGVKAQVFAKMESLNPGYSVRNPNRGDVRQYRHRPGSGGICKGLQMYLCDDGQGFC